jgi:hypothetical protein
MKCMDVQTDGIKSYWAHIDELHQQKLNANLIVAGLPD